MNTNNQSITRYDYIDALRGIAAVAVLVYHIFEQLGKHLPKYVFEYTSQGARGVQLFYVLSACTLFMSLDSRERKGKPSFRDFFIRRFFRVAPLFYFAVILYLWLYGTGPRFALGSRPGVTGMNIASNFLFLNGFSPYWINSVVPVGWSVTVEMVFYLLVPFLFLKIRNLSSAILFATFTWIGAMILYMYMAPNPQIEDIHLWHEFLFLWLPNQLPVFALGIVLFFIIRDRSSDTPSPAVSFHAQVLLLLSMALMYALVERGYTFLPRHLLYGITFVLFTYGLSIYPSSIFVNRFFRYAGKISYSLYLTHVICLRFAMHVNHYLHDHEILQSNLFPVAFVLVMVSSFVVATITYHLIEQPFQRLGARIIKK